MKKNIGILFTGYGSQHIGMGKDLYDTFRTAQEYIEQATSCLDINFVKLLFASSDQEISKIENAYISIFLIQALTLKILEEENIQPDIVGGFDIGEFSAAYAAGSITFVDALYFINKYATNYAEFIKDKKFKIISISECQRTLIQESCSHVTKNNDFATISIYQSSTDHIVSGTISAIKELETILHENNKSKIIIKEIHLGIGMHSFIMDEVVKSIKMYLEKIDIKSSNIPFISSVIGQTLQDGETIIAALMQHINAPLHTDDLINGFIDCDIIIQIGNNKYYNELVSDALSSKKLYIVNDKASIETLKNNLSKGIV